MKSMVATMIEPFAIATLPLPEGGRIGLCRLPGRSSDLSGNVSVIRDWKPAIVVSMTEATEMAESGAGNLPALLASSGIAWRHFPVADFGVPEMEMLPQWTALSAELHARLDAGEGVLLHCMGGLGRSGMIALRLAVERGEGAEAALARLRMVRPGAVETEAQGVWASSPSPPGEGVRPLADG
jgi:Cyclin-dependent kinase inhibitor 3 (CDKN3)